jgi:hypothetical protein
MPRRDAEEGVGCDEAAAAVRLAAKKIRKRRELSSSGASDPAAARRRLRSRRPAVLLPRRRTSGGRDRGESPPRSAGDMSESSLRSRHWRGGNRLADGTRPSASARLVGAFWQMDKEMLFEGNAEAMRRSVVPWSGASTEVSGVGS